MTDVATPAKPRKLSVEVRRALAAVKAGTASETEWQRLVIAYAKDHGWLVHHSKRAKVDGKWMTPVWGHTGYVDLTMTRNDRLVLIELKVKGQGPSPEQQLWHWPLERVAAGSRGAVHFGVYYPHQWPTVRALLR